MKIRILVITLVVLLVGGCVAFWFLGGGMISGWCLDWAETAAQKGDAGKAEFWYQTAISRDPQNEEARLSFARFYEDQENYSQAEATLSQAIQDRPGSVTFYEALSALYVRQDKLLDAANLLDQVPDASAKAVLDDMRPTTPIPSTEPGTFGVVVDLSFSFDGDCYLSTSGTAPSMASDKRDSVTLSEEGTYEVMAIAVNSDGLVSSFFKGTYVLENLVFPIQFADPAVETIARILLDKPQGEILSSDTRLLTSFRDADDQGNRLVSEPIQSLSDFHYFPNLTELSLTSGEKGLDLSVLPELTSLTHLTLSSCQIDSTALKELSGMLGLQYLDLDHNQVSTLGALQDLKNLQTLHLSYNNIADPSPLAPLTQLTELTLDQNAVGSLQGLDSLGKLTTLSLSTNMLTDLTGAAGMGSLKTLDVSHNQLTSLAPLANHPLLEDLDCSGNQLTNLDDIKGCLTLKRLSASSNSLTDLLSLSALTALETLEADGNQLKVLNGLSDLKNLTTLSVNKNQLTSVSPLSGLTALVTLRIEYNEVASLSPLSSCTNLKSVYAFENPLTDTALSGVTVYTSN